MAKLNVAPCPQSLAVTGLIPMAHVADVDRSVRFYGLLGFEVGDTLRRENGPTAWASVRCRNAAIMFARADGPVLAPEQAVLFYLYTRNLSGLREHLLRAGVRDRGEFTGGHPDGVPTECLWAITRPAYMPLGEFRVHDPDGYCLLIGQLESERG